MCGFDQATVAQSLCRYASIIDAIRQGQQKIGISAVARFLTPLTKNFLPPNETANSFFAVFLN